VSFADTRRDRAYHTSRSPTTSATLIVS
jgi:hypothetical protein